MNRRLKSQELARASPTSRRETISRGGVLSKFRTAAAAATLAFALACGTASVVTPTTVRAEEAVVKSKKVNLESLTVVKLKKPLKDLDNESEKYRQGEFIPNGDNGVENYSNHLRVPGEVGFLVTLSGDGKQKVLGVRFPAERDTSPDAEEPGLRGADLQKFAKLVKKMTGKELERVKIIVDVGTYKNNGKEMTYANAYFLPIDSEGKVITNVGNGSYLAYTTSYYGSTVLGAESMIVEPNNQTTLALARR